MADLEEQQSSARSDSFRDRVGGWISELEESISRKREKIGQINDRIAELQAKLS
ncbi:MAG: hypothetical protein HYR84_07405 [Planctomycetes bacterium]|nr:hypothetical protein [Planctomycetota bacterium]